MLRFDLHATLLLLLTSPVALTAQPADGPDGKPARPDLEQIKNPPPREIQFEHKQESFRLKLFRADPKLLEQKFVVFVQFKMRLTVDNKAIQSLHFLEGGFDLRAVQLLFPRGQSIFDLHRIPADSGEISTYFREVLQATPEFQRPDASIVEFFQSPEVDRGYIEGRRLDIRGGSEREYAAFEFRLLATDKESGEARARALVQLMDWGVSRTVQLSLWEKRTATLARLTELQKSVQDFDQQIAQDKDRLNQTKDLNADGLTDLRTQQWLLQVDIAGAKARVEACDKLLKGSLTESRSNQVLDLKITAEIELAGLTAKKSVLDELVLATRNRKELEATSQLRKIQRDDEASKRDRAKIDVLRLENSLVKFAPLPLVDDKIVIQPIQWGDSEK